MRRGFQITVLLGALLVNGYGQDRQTDPGSAASPEQRAEAWKHLKIKKSQNLQPYRIGPVEKAFLWAENKFTSDGGGGGFTGVSPLVGTVSSGSGPSMGLEYRRERGAWIPVDLALSGMYSTKGYQAYELQFGHLLRRDTSFTVDPIGERLITEFTERKKTEKGFTYYADIQFRHLPQENFYGLGPDTQRETETNYRLRSASSEGVAGFQLTDWFGASLRAGFVQFDLGPGTDSAFPDVRTLHGELTAPGLVTEPDFWRSTAGVVLDSRDKPTDAHSGHMVGLLVSHYNDRKGNLSEFTRLALDARHYIPLASRYRTLALRLAASSDQVPRGQFVPFYLQEPLGGINGVRGFNDFRFRDRNLLLGSAEYRWDAAEFLQMVLFYDAGKVFSRTSEFGFSGLEKGFGGGVRLRTANGILLRLELAHSREGNVLHFKLGPAF